MVWDIGSVFMIFSLGLGFVFLSGSLSKGSKSGDLMAIAICDSTHESSDFRQCVSSQKKKVIFLTCCTDN